jgi:hypothetical protein
MASERPQSPGLKWRPRKTGPDVPGWYASAAAVAAGYPVKFVNLSTHADHPVLLVERCQRLQSEMLLWMSGQKSSAPAFDGTFKSLLQLYQTDPDSPFNTSLKPAVVLTYTVYLKKLISHIGPRRIDLCDGRDVMKWFALWRVGPEGRDQLGAARMARAVLLSAISFGIICRLPGCKALQDVLAELKFETLKPRGFAPTAEQIVAARKAAHAAGAPRRALAYAILFETTLRPGDVVGRWLAMSDPKPSTLFHRGEKWIGLTWAAIDDRLILAKVKPAKTEGTTEVEVSFDLAVCPMVIEELALIPKEQRRGPLIVAEANDRPYSYDMWRRGWRDDFRAAGLPAKMWVRDMRAGGITEGGIAGASRDDRRTVAGHSDESQTMDYERGTVSLEAHRRTMAARLAFREKKE